MSVASDLVPFEDPRGPRNLPPAQAARMQKAGLITKERGRWVLTVEGLQALDKKLRGRSSGATGDVIVASESPLKYPHGSAHRISIVDPSAPPPVPGEPYFAEVIRTSKYSAKGKLLSKPRVVEKIPGAFPGTRAWIDYSAGPGYVYIHYMRTRSDSLQRGLQRRLVDALVERYGQNVDYDFGPVHHEGVWKLLEALRARGIQARGKVYFR
jgi:hypothetical protein